MAKKKRIFPIFLILTLVLGIGLVGFSFTQSDLQFDLALLSTLELVGIDMGLGGTVIFSDGFSTDPASNGWTESSSQFTLCNASGDCFPTTAIGSITQASVCPFSTPTDCSDVALFQKTGLVSGIRLNIDRTIDTTGFTNIGLNLRAFQGDRSVGGSSAPDCLPIEDDPNIGGSQVVRSDEPAVALRIFVDYGTGFERRLIDMQQWNGEDLNGWECESEFGGNAGGQEFPKETGILLLDQRADNNPNLKIMISTTTYVVSSDYFIDHFELLGDVGLLGVEDPACPAGETLLTRPDGREICFSCPTGETLEIRPDGFGVCIRQCPAGTVNEMVEPSLFLQLIRDCTTNPELCEVQSTGECTEVFCPVNSELVGSDCIPIVCPIGQIPQDNICVEVMEIEDPVACILIFDPVCGVNGQTFSNSCFAEASGFEILHSGECVTTDPIPSTNVNIKKIGNILFFLAIMHFS